MPLQGPLAAAPAAAVACLALLNHDMWGCRREVVDSDATAVEANRPSISSVWQPGMQACSLARGGPCRLPQSWHMMSPNPHRTSLHRRQLLVVLRVWFKQPAAALAWQM